MDTFEKKRTMRHELAEMNGVLHKEGRTFKRKKPYYCRLSGSVLNFYPPEMEEAVNDAMQFQPSEKEIQINNVVKGSRKLEIIVQDFDLRTTSIYVNEPDEFEMWFATLCIAAKSRIESFYEFGQVLGKGSYGIVRLGRDRQTKELVAIKILEKATMKEKDYRLLRREMVIAAHLKHDNIVSTLDIFDTSTRLYLVLEFMPGGMLYDVIAQQGRFSESHAAVIMKDLFESLSYLHSHSIMHRDIKPENLLCTRNRYPLNVKLADFGFAKFIDNMEEYTLGSAVGTPYYVAPEVVKKEGYNTFCDMWSAGIIMYNLLSGKRPFEGTKRPEVLAKIKEGQFTFPNEDWDDISAEAKRLIRGLLQVDPSKRLSARGALNHPWFEIQLNMTAEQQKNLRAKVENLSTNKPSNQRFKHAVQTIIVANRFQLHRLESSDSDDEDTRRTLNALNISDAKADASKTRPVSRSLSEERTKSIKMKSSRLIFRKDV
eukprot:CAMPEP_0184696982 /NCGR_PEP_ID=MMETSP0313-20130426/4123_1 /TAXON_ID=2792 /ORGANISM="Porphyridium aerugineum, Strain SAG 1380-2" /LENGTH=485 /DNA_ID=CAMNT_0027155741 /DNA_START=196 /DNA_END=1653 /DNA_ORIENTATION=+